MRSGCAPRARYLIALCCASICLAPGVSSAADNTADITIDADSGGVAGIYVGMTEVEIQSLRLPLQKGLEMQEGQEYTVYDLSLPQYSVVRLFMSDTGVHRITTQSPAVLDQHGLSAGALLRGVQEAYPDGRLITEDADGYVASYVTGTHLVFDFDPADFDIRCFDMPACDVDNTIAVKSIRIESIPVD